MEVDAEKKARIIKGGEGLKRQPNCGRTRLLNTEMKQGDRLVSA